MNPNRNARISILITIFTLAIIIAIASYLLTNQREDSKNEENQSYDIALLCNTDKDHAISTQCRQAMEASASSLDKSCKTYTVDYMDAKAYETAIQTAVTNKAKLVICPDNTFAETVYKVQNNYLHTYFLLLNSSPHNTNLSDNTIAFNVLPIQFDEAEMGFLAGYALVYEGLTALTLVSSAEDACSIHYEYGFLQGANTAATELNLKSVNIECYHATDLEDAKRFANKHYQLEPTLVSTCELYTDALYEIAKEQEKKLVVCSNYYTKLEESGPLIAISTKNIAYAISDIISNFYEGTINGGKVNFYSAANQGISFKFDETYFKKFTNYTLQQIYNILANDEIQIISDTTVTTDELGLKRIILK